jgi:DNA-binding PucR family transcriptional regulator
LPLSGSWRLLLRVAAGDPRQLEALVDSTVGPALARGRASLVELLDTLRAYLDHGANMNATAAAIYAHRHTIAHRLGRIRELTGHDPQTPRGQAQLALGLQALAICNAAAAPLSSSSPPGRRRAATPGLRPTNAARR